MGEVDMSCGANDGDLQHEDDSHFHTRQQTQKS